MSDKHALITGPVTGLVTLADGTAVNIGPEVVLLDSLEQVAEVAHRIGLIHAERGHPDDVERDAAGVLVQREFVYDDSHHKAHCAPSKKGK